MSFCEPPPQGTSPIHQGQDWLFRLGQFLCRLLPLSINQGGTGQTTAQSAINALTQVNGATSGYVLTKNATTGNADWEPGGGGSGLVNSVSTSDPALTIAPTTGAVVVSANDFVGDSGSGGTHGDVPAPAAGDAAAGKVLKADGTWGTAGTTSPLTTKGDVYGFSTVNDRIPVGSNTQVLTADSTQALGVKWATPTTGTVTSIATTAPITGGTITTTGTIGVTDFVASGASHARGTVPDPGASAGTAKFLCENATWSIPAGSFTSPLTTKGDLLGYDTADNRVPIGANGSVLTADSTQALGLKWAAQSTAKLQSVEFGVGTTNWTGPTGVTLVWAVMIAAGGGGSCTILAATGGGGGGSGELALGVAIATTSGGTITVVVGAKGTGGATGQGSAQVGVAGGDTTITATGNSGVAITYTVKGGKGGATTGASGAGGGINGNAAKGTGSPGAAGALGTIEAPDFFGGNSGGGGGSVGSAAGGSGSGAPGFPTGAAAGSAASSQAGGGGGANTMFGVGGAGGNGGSAGNSAAAASYGTGGGGAGGHATTTLAGGDGADGYVILYYVA